MYVECWVIIAILLTLSYMYMRNHRGTLSLATLPLVIVPLVHIFSGPLVRFLEKIFSLPYLYMKVSFDVLAIVITCTIIGAISRHIPSKAARRVYIGMCGGFSLILALVLIYNTLHK